MKTITFPKNEWNDIKARLETGKRVCTIRVDKELDRYKLGDTLATEWGDNIKIISVKKITGGIERLKSEYEFFEELTKEMLEDLEGCDEMEIIVFESVS